RARGDHRASARSAGPEVGAEVGPATEVGCAREEARAEAPSRRAQEGKEAFAPRGASQGEVGGERRQAQGRGEDLEDACCREKSGSQGHSCREAPRGARASQIK